MDPRDGKGSSRHDAEPLHDAAGPAAHVHPPSRAASVPHAVLHGGLCCLPAAAGVLDPRNRSQAAGGDDGEDAAEPADDATGGRDHEEHGPRGDGKHAGGAESDDGDEDHTRDGEDVCRDDVKDHTRGHGPTDGECRENEPGYSKRAGRTESSRSDAGSDARDAKTDERDDERPRGPQVDDEHDEEHGPGNDAADGVECRQRAAGESCSRDGEPLARPNGAHDVFCHEDTTSLLLLQKKRVGAIPPPLPPSRLLVVDVRRMGLGLLVLGAGVTELLLCSAS
mmetsp:Transcript_51101/g.159682  ORF Transcript_51101/g.159682 Transcript_51101/m.159682 type:complete len:281 (+) Transcript_51101:411-1253(+)